LKKNSFSVYIAVSRLDVIHVSSPSVSFLPSFLSFYLFSSFKLYYLVLQKSSDVEEFLKVVISSTSRSSHASLSFGFGVLVLEAHPAVVV
jgi:hypothetical protein